MLVTGISLVSGFAIVIFNDLRSFKQDLVNKAFINAKLIGEYCITPLDFGYDNAAIEAVNKLQTIPEITTGIVFDENGDIFASFRRDGEKTAIPKEMPKDPYFYFTDDALHVFQPIKSAKKTVGTIYLESTTVFLHQKIQNYLISMGAILIVMLLISYFSARALQRIISKPILGLVSAANTVSQKTDYSVRVQKEGEDEIGVLYDGFNAMLMLIESRDKELRTKSEELHQRNLELENLIETSPDAILITDASGVIGLVNHQFVHMVSEKGRDAIIGRNISEFVLADDQLILKTALDTIEKSGRTSDIELTINQKDNIIQVEMNSSLVTDTESDSKNIIHIVRDVSERKLLEDNIQRLRKEYEAFMRHEIKNILFPIQGNAEILLITKNDTLDNEQTEHLKIIYENAQHAGRLIDNLKKLQDIEQGRYVLNTKTQSIEDTIKKAIDNLDIFTEENNVSIKYSTDSDVPEISLDSNLVPGVFFNVIKNAVEHVKDCSDQSEKTIDINLKTSDNRLFITINNKGDIIPPDRLELFFEKFNSDRLRKKAGTGLGTTYAYLVAKAHGWDIKVDSNEKDGTTITIVIDFTK